MTWRCNYKIKWTIKLHFLFPIPDCHFFFSIFCMLFKISALCKKFILFSLFFLFLLFDIAVTESQKKGPVFQKFHLYVLESFDYMKEAGLFESDKLEASSFLFWILTSPSLQKRKTLCYLFVYFVTMYISEWTLQTKKVNMLKLGTSIC